MQIAIQDDGAAVGGPLRAYIEYRMFSALSRFGGSEMCLTIRLEDRSVRACEHYRCSAVLKLGRAGSVRARASGDRAYAAIDRAAQRLSARVARLLSSDGLQ